MAVSYDLIGGLLGYLYLGHGLFFGLGAYVTVLLSKDSHHLLLALLLAGCITLPTAALISLPLFRLRGAVFALATLGLLFLGGHITSNLSELTGGAAGLSLPPNPDAVLTYSLSLVLALAAVFIHWLICNSRLGLMIASIQESEDIAESVGINCGRIKRLVLVISSVPAALAGGLYAREVSFVVPEEAFGLENSLAPLLMCLLFKPGTTGYDLGTSIRRHNTVDRSGIHLDYYPKFPPQPLRHPPYVYRNTKSKALLGETGCRARRMSRVKRKRHNLSYSTSRLARPLFLPNIDTPLLVF